MIKQYLLSITNGLKELLFSLSRKILIVLVMLSLKNMLLAQPGTTQSMHPSGSGSMSDPYLIESLANLRWMSENNSEWWDYTNPTTYFKQTVDIDAMETMNWNNLKGFKPIGFHANIMTEQGVTTGTWFLGVYDGNGKIISNLYINQEDTTPSKTGMFSMMHNAVIKNLGLVNVFFKANPPTNQEGTTLGGIVGLASSSTIDNCYITGILEAYAGFGYIYMGGIAGHARNTSTISNCYSASSIKGNAKNFGDVIDTYLGGIAGFLENNSTISNCYNSGELKGTGNISSVGGIVSNVSSSTINNCYSKGLLHSSSYGSQKIVRGAGIAAKVFNGNISLCYSTGTISTIGDFPWVGGIAGDIQNTIILNCYSKITLPSYFKFSGGIVGRVYSSASNNISKCYFAGSSSQNGGAIAGGIEYGSALNIQDCLWDAQKTGLNKATGTLPNGNVVNSYGKTTAEMKQKPTYIGVGWDFVNSWNIDPVVNDGYAYLENAGLSAGIFNIISDENPMLVYPNPTNGKVSIDLGYDYDEIILTVYSINGQKIEQIRFKNQQLLELNLDVPNGIYFISIESKSKKATIRLIRN